MGEKRIEEGNIDNLSQTCKKNRTIFPQSEIKANMKKYLYGLIKWFVKKYSNNVIVGKPLKLTEGALFYEKAQHLTFLFQKNISYESNIQEKICRHITEGYKVFDIGGNIGQYAVLFSGLVGNTGKVYSFEPDAKNYAFLNFNKNINFRSNLNCLNIGVGEKAGKLTFYRDTITGGRRGSFKQQFVKDAFEGKKQEVEVRTLDSLVEEFGKPDFIKIDVEGFEEVVLAGQKKNLDDTKFLVEVRSETRQVVFDHFDKDKFKCYWIDQKEDVLISSASEIPTFANLLFVPKERKI